MLFTQDQREFFAPHSSLAGVPVPVVVVVVMVPEFGQPWKVAAKLLFLFVWVAALSGISYAHSKLTLQHTRLAGWPFPPSLNFIGSGPSFYCWSTLLYSGSSAQRRRTDWPELRPEISNHSIRRVPVQCPLMVNRGTMPIAHSIGSGQYPNSYCCSLWSQIVFNPECKHTGQRWLIMEQLRPGLGFVA